MLPGLAGYICLIDFLRRGACPPTILNMKERVFKENFGLLWFDTYVENTHSLLLPMLSALRIVVFDINILEIIVPAESSCRT